MATSIFITHTDPLLTPVSNIYSSYFLLRASNFPEKSQIECSIWQGNKVFNEGKTQIIAFIIP